MPVKNAENRGQLEFVGLENMVPQDHLLRRSMCSAGAESRGRGRMSGHRSNFCGRNAIC